MSKFQRVAVSGLVLVVVLGAGTMASAQRGGRTGDVITYQGILELVRNGTSEVEVLQRLRDSVATTTFTLDQSQVAELTRAGASPRLVEVLQQLHGPAAQSSDVGDFAFILDCSGSMKAPTPGRTSKMDEAKRVLTEFIRGLPDGKRLALIVFGIRQTNDKTTTCNDVQVLRSLGPLDGPTKDQLAVMIAKLRPFGETPLARALEVAGRELQKGQGLCQLVLITDGMETCGGDPAQVALDLTRRLNMPHGVDVVGFGVSPAEKQALQAIVARGKGHFYDAREAGELVGALEKAQREARERAEAASREARGRADLALRSALDAASREEQEKQAARDNLARIEAEERAKAEAEKEARRRAEEEARRAEQTIDPVLRILIKNLKDPDCEIRAQAATKLRLPWIAKKPDAQKAVPSLIRVIVDDLDGQEKRYTNADRNKDAAVWALKALAPEKVKPTLLQAAESRSDGVKQWAVDWLTRPKEEPR